MSTSEPLHIVRLDGVHAPAPVFNIPHVYTEYPLTPFDSIAERIKTADVILTTRVPLTAALLDPAVSPRLRLVAIVAIGSDMIDLAACAARGITVCNVPAASNEAVSEHAIALYMAVRRRIVDLHALTVEGVRWPELGTLKGDFGDLPGTWREEVVGIIGAGDLGSCFLQHCHLLIPTVNWQVEILILSPHLISLSSLSFSLSSLPALSPFLLMNTDLHRQPHRPHMYRPRNDRPPR